MDNAQLNDNKKKRLATTRGFGTASSFGGTAPSEVNSFITPQNSPSKFLPQVKSTPANDLLTVPDLSSNRKRNLPPRPPSPLPGVSSIGVSVISPNPYPHSQGSQDQSLEWDNSVYSLPTNLDSTFVVNDTIEGVQNINLVPNNSIPIVDTSESSLSVSSFTKSMSVFQFQTPDQMDSATRELIQRDMTEKSDNIAVLIEDFNDMLEDFSVADVNRGNSQFVKEKTR